MRGGGRGVREEKKKREKRGGGGGGGLKCRVFPMYPRSNCLIVRRMHLLKYWMSFIAIMARPL